MHSTLLRSPFATYFQRLSSKLPQNSYLIFVVFIGEMFAVGSTSYAFGLFVIPVSDEFGISRSTANSGLVLLLIGTSLTAPFIGRLFDRFSFRVIIVTGGLCMGAGFMLIGISSSTLLNAIVLICMIGPSVNAIGPLAANTAISKHVHNKRGLVLGIAAVATSIGGAVFVPLMAFHMDLLGWRASLFIQGALIGILVPLVASSFIRRGSLIANDGASGESLTGDDQRESAVAPVREVAAKPTLRSWLDMLFITSTVALTYCVGQAVNISLIPHLVDRGIAASSGAYLLSTMALSSVFGKILFGYLSDYISRKVLLVLITCTLLLEVYVLSIHPSFEVLLMVMALCGFTIGGELPVWAGLVSEKFGVRRYGRIMGSMQLFVSGASVAAIWLVGSLYDSSQNYASAFQYGMVIACISLICAIAISGNTYTSRHIESD